MELREKIERERKDKDRFFQSHPQSPLPRSEKEGFDGLSYYEVKPELRFELELHEHDEKEKIEVDDSTGGRQEYLRWGEFRFTLNGQEYNLQAYKSKPGESRLWVPFKDETNGEETYGAGRYLDLESKRHKKGNKWVLDFNQAYNPFCAYSEHYTCPFIPPDNWLEVRIEAGEKNYQKKE